MREPVTTGCQQKGASQRVGVTRRQGRASIMGLPEVWGEPVIEGCQKEGASQR